MNLQVTDSDILNSTLVFAFLSSILVIPSILVFRNEQFIQAKWPITISSGILWGIFAVVAVFGFWELYYQYLYQPWLRWLTPLDAFLYAAIGLGMWWLAGKLPGSAVLWFVLFGGLEGVLEHLIGIYNMHILEKVPWLQGVSAVPVVAFSFFEYTFYWAIIAWLAYLVSRIFTWIT